MKKLKTGLLLSVIGCLTFFATMLSACGTEKVTLSTTGDVTSLKPGDSVQLLIDGNTPEGFTFRINEGSNYAEIDENGVLTINVNAEPGKNVKVSAEKDKAKSNEITLTVDTINLTNLVASATTTEVMRNNFYDLTKTATPSNTTEQISWVIVDGADYAEISGDRLIVKSTAPYGTTIKVKAKGETMSSNVLEFTVVEFSSEGLSLRGEDEVEKLDAAASAYTYSIDVRNSNNQSVPGKTLSYTIVEGANNLSVAQNGYNFVLTATGHGTATLRITMGEEYHDVTVNCIKAPTAITLPEVLQSKTNIEFSTGKNQDIKNFNLNFIGSNVCQNVTFKFEKWDTEESAWVDSTAGTFNAGTLKFTEEGKFKVTATSNSGSAAEKSVSKEFTVNNGINVSTFEEFKTALQSSKPEIVGKPINIVNMQSNKIIPAFILSGEEQTSDKIMSVQTWVQSGELNLLGNGYEIDLSGLATEGTETDVLGHFITINDQQKTENTGSSEADHKVVIKDLTLTGNVDINDDFNSSSKKPAGKLERAIYINSHNDNVSYLVDINNVKISKFGVGIRVTHAVSYNGNVSKISNVTIQNIWSNGIELAASQIIVDSINVQQCGAFALEVTPDEFGKAGLNFNENQTIQFAGEWNVQNMNSGTSKHLIAFEEKMGLGVNAIIQGSVGDKAEDLAVLSNVMNSAQELNMIALVLHDIQSLMPPVIVPNLSNITDSVFANSIINFNDLTGVDTTHKYIQIDLVFSSISLGRAYVYNLNYAG